MADLSITTVGMLLLFLILPFICGWGATKFRLPTLVGYIIGGIILGIFVHNQAGKLMLSQLASIGVILLLFLVGLELDISQFIRYRRFIVIAGLLQVGISAFFIFLISFLFQFDFVPSLLIGFACALSSTAVVVKIIQEKGEEHSLLGGMTIGILLFQDIIAIPFLIVVSSLSVSGSVWNIVFSVVFSLIKLMIVFILMYFVGKKAVPFIFGRLAKTSRELLNLLTLIFILIAVMVFSFLKLPATVAAFLSGVLIAHTLEHYHIFSQMRPLRDIFAILFFVFLGSQIDFSIIVAQFPLIIIFTILLFLIKSIVLSVIFIALRLHSRTAFSAGLLLFQAGEFAFIILQEGVSGGVISNELSMIVLSVVVISISITPILARYKDILYFSLKKIAVQRAPSFYAFLESRDREPAHVHAVESVNHVVICGYGRLGSYIGRALYLAGISFIAIDYNVHTVMEAKKKGISIIYGDPTDIDVLDYVHTEKAKMLIIAVPDTFSQEAIILHGKRLNRHIAIFARTHKEEHQRRMKDLGAHTVIQPEFEAALSMIKKILLNFNIPRDTIVGKIKRLKLEHGMV